MHSRNSKEILLPFRKFPSVARARDQLENFEHRLRGPRVAADYTRDVRAYETVARDERSHARAHPVRARPSLANCGVGRPKKSVLLL